MPRDRACLSMLSTVMKIVSFFCFLLVIAPWARADVRQEGKAWVLEDSQLKVTVGAENAHLTVLDKTSGTLWRQEDPSTHASNKDDVRVRRAAKPIVVDGNPEEWSRIPHDDYVWLPWMGDNGEANCSGGAKVMWDDEMLYLYVRIRDDNVAFGGESTEQWWESDSVEFWVDSVQVGLHLAPTGKEVAVNSRGELLAGSKVPCDWSRRIICRVRVGGGPAAGAFPGAEGCRGGCPVQLRPGAERCRPSARRARQTGPSKLLPSILGSFGSDDVLRGRAERRGRQGPGPVLRERSKRQGRGAPCLGDEAGRETEQPDVQVPPSGGPDRGSSSPSDLGTGGGKGSARRGVGVSIRGGDIRQAFQLSLRALPLGTQNLLRGRGKLHQRTLLAGG